MDVKNNLVKTEEKKNVVNFTVDGMDVKLSPTIIRSYLVNGNGNVTDQEINYFIQLCKARQLNPHVKDAYLIKYGSQPATMVVSKDAIERRAIKHPQYNGKKVGIYVLDKENELVKREHSILLENEKLVGAWCEVYRKDWEFPAKADVNYEEYAGRKSDGTVNSQWANKPVTMLTKVAKAQALREAFIEELGGMYDSSEMSKDIPNIEEIIEAPKQDLELKDFLEENKEEIKGKQEKILKEAEKVEEDEEIQELFGKK